MFFFVVNPFHHSGHKGCSSGYNLTKYNKSIDIKQINKQINEQTMQDYKTLKGICPYVKEKCMMLSSTLQ